MWILLIPATLAALVCFRWARTLAIFAIAAAAVWFWLIVAGHAQSYPMVQCRIGTVIREVTDFQCDAMLRGARMIDVDRYQQTYPLCAREMARHLDAPWQSFAPICTEMWSGLFKARANRIDPYMR